MKRRLLPILMTLVLVCALSIWTAFVTSGDVTNPLLTTAAAAELTLQAMIERANAGDTITLSSNTEIHATLEIKKNLTLDLNGHVLKMTGEGSVLRVKKDGESPVTLTITDSRSGASHEDTTLPVGGVITGGKGTEAGAIHYVGGAVFLENDTKLKLEGGTITGNSSSGSVFISDETVVFEMSGGTITGEAVGVYNNGGTFTMTGGRITGCSDRGVYMYNGNMTVSGTAYIGGNDTNQYTETADIYVQESVRKVTGLSVTGGIIEGKVYIFFETSNMKPNDESKDDNYNVEAMKKVANSAMTAADVFDGHIQVKMKDDDGTSVDYNTVNFIDEVAKTRTLKLVLQRNAVEEPNDPTKSGYTFIGWEDADGAYDFSKPVTAPLTLTAKWEKVPSSGGYYYYPTTDTKADDTKGSPKTADPGIALYAALSLLSLTGLTCTTKAFPLRGRWHGVAVTDEV